MSQHPYINRQWVLAERPSGAPTSNTLRLIETAVTAPGAGQMLLRTVFLSLDPYMRGRMSDAPSYAAPVVIGDVMVGGTVSRVVESHLPAFATGDWVLSYAGWQDYALSGGRGVTNLGPSPAQPSWALGVLGMPGFTAWAGLTLIGQPTAGETIVVAAATGPVGATVGQIGKLLGCRVVGIAGVRTRWIRLGSMRASTIRNPTWVGGSPRRRPAASMCTSRMSAAPCSTPCSRC
jgi:NADPH-dependent curcumin reductase CurA